MENARRNALSALTAIAISLNPSTSRADDVSDITDFSNTAKFKVGAGLRYSDIEVSNDLGSFYDISLGGVSVEALTPYINARYKFLDDGGLQPYVQFGVAHTKASFENDSPYLELPDQTITSVGGGAGLIYKGEGFYGRVGASAGRHFFEDERNRTDIRGSAFVATDISKILENTWGYGMAGFNSTGEQDNGVNPYNTFSIEVGGVRRHLDFYYGLAARDEAIDGKTELPNQKKHRLMVVGRAGYDKNTIFGESSNKSILNGDWSVHGYVNLGKETKEVGVQFILNY